MSETLDSDNGLFSLSDEIIKLKLHQLINPIPEGFKRTFEKDPKNLVFIMTNEDPLMSIGGNMNLKQNQINYRVKIPHIFQP